MITNSKKDQLMQRVREAIVNSGTVYPPGPINGPAYRELCDTISINIKLTVENAFEALIDDLYTQEQFEDDIGLK